MSTLINSPESTLTAAAKEMFSDMFKASAGIPRSGQKERQASAGVKTVNVVQETEEERKSLEMTDDKKVFLQSFAGGAVAWWAFGEPIMRGLGIL